MTRVFTLGFRGRLLLLLLAVFAVVIGMLVWQALAQRGERISVARESAWQSVRLIAAEQKTLVSYADHVLLSLMQLPQLHPDRSPEECSRILAQWEKAEPAFFNIGLARPNGDVVCRAIPMTSPRSEADRRHFQEALKTRDLVVSNVIVTRTTGKPTVAFARSLWDDAGRVVGVFYIGLELAWLNRELANAHLPAGSSLSVVDGEGITLARYPDAEGWVGKSVEALPLFRRLTATGEGVAEEPGPTGTSRIVAFIPLMDTIAGRIYLWVGIPKDAVTQAADRDLRRFALISLALLLAAFWILWLSGARWFLRPVTALSGAARRIGEGDLTARTGLAHADDELGQLARSFDGMAGGLQSRERQLIRVNRALRVLSAGNRTLLRAKDERALLENMCRAITEAGDYRLAWVSYAEHGPARTVRTVAAWGAAKDFLDGLGITWDETEAGRGPTGTAIRLGKPVASNDIAADPECALRREAMRRAGIAAALALPLRLDGAVIGALCIGAAEPGAFDEYVIELLSEAADDLAFGIATLRAEVEHGRVRAALATAEDRFHAAAEANIDALFILKSVRSASNGITDFEFLDLNPRAEQMLGMARAQVIGQRLCELPPFTRTGGFVQRYAAVVATGEPLEEEFPIDAPQIGAKWLRHQVVRVGDGIAIASRDITERKASERALQRANRALKTLSAGNAALTHAVSEEELLKGVTRAIVEIGGYRMAGVGYAQDDADKSIKPMAWMGREDGYIAEKIQTWADNEMGQRPISRTIRSGQPELARDIQNDPAFANWRESAARRGYASNLALPLSDGARNIGALNIYAGEPNAFDAEETRLLAELASDLSFGIVTLRTRAERDRIAYAHAHHAEILQKSLEQSIQVIADTVEARDPHTAGHQRRVGELAVAIAGELGMPEEKIHGIRLAAAIHDLGKIHVPAEILSKPGRISDIEFQFIKTHAQAGYDILRNVDFPWPIADIVHQHHERLDGSGYPQGLRDGQIQLESRIMAVADVVEAMASHRPYRASLGIEVALEEIARGRGSIYDPAVADACLKLFREGRFAFRA